MAKHEESGVSTEDPASTPEASGKEAATESTESKAPAEAKPEAAKPEAKAEEAKPEAKAEEAKPEEAKSEPKAEEAKPAAKAEEAKPAAKAEEAKPAAKAEEAKPAAKAEEAKPKAEAKPAVAKPAAKKPAAKKKPAEPEPEVSAESFADANHVFKQMFDMVERKQKLDRELLSSAERSYDRLMKQVEEQAKDMEAFKKKTERSLLVLSGFTQLKGGHAKLAQFYHKLQSLKELIEDARRL